MLLPPILKWPLVRLGALCGIRFARIEDPHLLVRDDSTTAPGLLSRFATIPGMISLDEGLFLYSLAYAAGADGDIAEIGSWQGRSTAFLAQACEDTGNGRVHAIDWFQGNRGKERLFGVAGGAERALRTNIERMSLSHRVVVHAKRSEDARGEVPHGLRMLFIDGEHTHEGVTADLHYAALLRPGGLLVFHDYSRTYAGVVSAATAHLARGGFARPFQKYGLLVARRLAGSA